MLVEVIRKSMLTSRSSLPSGASSRQVTSRRPGAWGAFVSPHGVVRPEQVAQEVLVAFARGAEQVGAPHREHPGEVRGVVGVVGREMRAVLPRSSSTTKSSTGFPALSASSAMSSGLRSNAGWEGSQPRRGRVRVEVDGALASEAALRRAGWPGRRPSPLVAPLVGGQVPERRARHVARGPHPVELRRRASTSR